VSSPAKFNLESEERALATEAIFAKSSQGIPGPMVSHVHVDPGSGLGRKERGKSPRRAQPNQGEGFKLDFRASDSIVFPSRRLAVKATVISFQP